MPKSSSDYLQALRQGNYLLFLQWPGFIVQHYSKRDKSAEPVGADYIVELLVFEWLNNGYCEDDAKSVALLYKISELKPNLFFADISYALVTIYNALMQCMAYQSMNVHLNFMSAEPKSIKEVVAFIESNYVEPEVFQTSLKIQQEGFIVWLKSCGTKELNKGMERICPILQLRRDIYNYVDDLQSSNSAKKTNSDKTLDVSRLSVVKRLLQYLNEQVELTDKVQQQIMEYAASIRNLSPEAFEKGILHKISPLSLADYSYSWVAKIGYFFNSVTMPQETDSADSSPKP